MGSSSGLQNVQMEANCIINCIIILLKEMSSLQFYELKLKLIKFKEYNESVVVLVML